MKVKILLPLFCLMLILTSSALATDGKDDAATKKDKMIKAKLKAKGVYPAIKASVYSGVMPVAGITERPDSTLKYKLLISLSSGTSDSAKVKELNRGLAEAGRIVNLHLAAGVPKENLQVVIVTHGKALYSLLNNEAFKKQFKADNPNAVIIKELEDAGAKFIACGQAMQFLEIQNEQLLPTVKIAIAAKVALSTYEQKGYSLFEIEDE